MKLKYIFTTIGLFSTLLLSAKEKDKDSVAQRKETPSVTAAASATAVNAAMELRSFDQLDKALQNSITLQQSYSATSHFTDAFIATNFPVDSSSAASRARAQAALDDIEKKNHYTDFLSPNDLVDLPIGMKKKFGSNSSVTIGVEKAKFMGAYTELTVFCKVDLPQSNENGQKRTLYFGADNIKLSSGGGLVGDANLVLLGDFPIPFNNGNMLLLLKGGKDTRVSDPTQNLTYIKLECGGIKELGLTADVQFPNSLLVPLDKNFQKIDDPNKRVTGSFSTKVTDWNDIMAEVSFDPFAIKGLDKFALSIEKAVFDFSDTKNSPDVRFPSDYQGLIPGREQLWRGIYFQKLVMMLPAEFRQGSGKRVSIEADNFIIDDQGITGTVAANNVMPMGDASGWKFSVDKFFITLKANSLTAAGFNGMIATPLQKNDDDKLDSSSGKAFTYNAIIAQDQYLMRVTTLSKLTFDVFQAQAEIDSSSYIELLVKNDRFLPKAVLNGRMGISITKMNDQDKNSTSFTQFKGVEFQQLQLQTEAPYLQANYFGYKGEVKFANFPIVLSNINLKAVGNDVALQFTLDVNLMQDKLSAGTTLTIFGELNQGGSSNDKGQMSSAFQYKYKRTQLDMISVDGRFNAFNIKGQIEFLRNHPILGDGFKGALELTLNSLGVKVDAQAAFGSTSFRYWYVDAMATGLHISTGYFNITGLGGGASYHINKRARDNNDPYSPVRSITPEPDESKGLGFKGVVAFNVGTSAICAGEVSLEMMFNSTGGLNNMGFYGKANVIPPDALKQLVADAAGSLGDELNGLLGQVYQKVENVAGDKIAKLVEKGAFDQLAKEAFPSELTSMKSSSGMISADLGITYDFENKTLHSTFDLYVNVFGVLTGVGANNRAGWAVMHFAPDEWYIHMGTPTDRLGLKMGVGSISVATTGYFMAGSRIPASPPPPKVVADILGVEAQQLDYMRDLNALGEGRGFAFGTDFSINTGDLHFLMFYASFQAGLGFDVMLKNYGDDYHCKSHPGAIGMNGWFANGQSYAYLQGELGIEVKLMFIRKKISIIKGGGAVLLQATLPNPSWFRGYLGGYFSVLGGLVKGNFRFKVEIGEKCEPVSNDPLANIKVISDFTPDDKTKDADVFTMPQAVFNFAVNKPFNVDDDLGTHVYRINLNKFDVTNNGTAISGKLRWNDMKTSVAFESDEILPPNTSLKASVVVTFEEQSGSSWKPVYDNGQPATEQKEVAFTTGAAPMVIPACNIEYAYPVVDQQYYLPKEYTEGYVQLKRGQSYLFNQNIHNLVAQFGEASASAVTADAPFAYDSVNRRVNWHLPVLKTTGKYTLNFAGLPKTINTDKAVTTSSQQLSTDADGNNIQVADNKASGTLIADKPHTYLTYQFESSRYNTFVEKMADKKMRKPMYEIIYSDVGALHAEINTSGEPFDVAELTGTDKTENKALVQPVAILSDDYYTNSIGPLLYNQYPKLGFVTSRDTAEMGLPPVRAVEVTDYYLSNAQAKNNNPLQTSRMPYRYNLPYYYKQDFISLQYQIVNFYKGAVPQNLKPFIEKAFPAMKQGNYGVQLKYVVPGGRQTSVVGFEYKYE
jgi:hypothetical protein